MKIENRFYSLELCDETGAILSFRDSEGYEFIHKNDRPLAEFFLFDGEGNRTNVSTAGIRPAVRRESGKLVLSYEKLGGLDVSAEISVRFSAEDAKTYWGLKLRNRSGLQLDKIDYPNVVVPNRLTAHGGDCLLFWPAMEGAVIDDLDIREGCGMKYKEITFPSWGWEGRYPGACQMQFMAFYNEKTGLYFATHDEDCHPKAVEFAPYDEKRGIRLIYQVFPGKDDTSDYELPYETVLGAFEGDWHDAADVYREWAESSKILRIPKSRENPRFPKWLEDSPVVIMYAVFGEENSARIEEEIYYPYTSILPHIDRLNKAFDSKIMTLVCHWESTAPWAPPYMWPPKGSLENFQDYIKALHDQGNRIGLYCSGLGWSQQSGLIPSYSREEQFEREHLADAMQVGPDQKLVLSNICGWPLRRGYDMCPATEFAKKVTLEEYNHIIDNLDVDYIQYFDQNLGGNSYSCYSKKHGHPKSPGVWQNEAMIGLFDEMYRDAARKGNDVAIGCEADAAEPFMDRLVFNDSRHNITYYVGTSVSAYNYVYHEYVQNFMGNQNTSSTIINHELYPDNTYYRVAHGFAQGDFLTVVLKNDGKINRDCCTAWSITDLDQKEIQDYIKHLNGWRKNYGREALYFGRMVKPFEIDCGRYYEKINYGGRHNFPKLVTSRYQTGDKTIQFVVNFLSEPQTAVLKVPKGTEGKLVRDCYGKELTNLSEKDGTLTFEIPARTAYAVEI